LARRTQEQQRAATAKRLRTLQAKKQRLIKFQKTLALFASASNLNEADAAEQAARRLLAQYNIDPTERRLEASLYNGYMFTDNALLKKLRDEWWEQMRKRNAEWRAQHPDEPLVEQPSALSDWIAAQIDALWASDDDTQPLDLDEFFKKLIVVE
jgi:hypothetical protein